jgi:molecular chaperone GrpE
MTEGHPNDAEKRGPTAEELNDWEDVFAGGDRAAEAKDPADAGASPPPAGDLAAMTAERDKYLDLARRTRADFENYQTRARRDMEAERRYAATALVAELLPVMDNLERALDSARKAHENATLIEGIEIVRRQFADTLGKHGVAPIKPDNVPFDPNLHQAVMQQPSADHPPMTVLMTVETGYKLHDRVIRPAKVIVSAAPAG